MLSNATKEPALGPGQQGDYELVTRANLAATDSLRASRLR
jgi:hypothetical protein